MCHELCVMYRISWTLLCFVEYSVPFQPWLPAGPGDEPAELLPLQLEPGLEHQRGRRLRGGGPLLPPHLQDHGQAGQGRLRGRPRPLVPRLPLRVRLRGQLPRQEDLAGQPGNVSLKVSNTFLPWGGILISIVCCRVIFLMGCITCQAMVPARLLCLPNLEDRLALLGNSKAAPNLN